MNTKRRSQHYSHEDYRASRESLRQRSQQPVSRPRGNYRVDEQGNPILPSFESMPNERQARSSTPPSPSSANHHSSTHVSASHRGDTHSESSRQTAQPLYRSRPSGSRPIQVPRQQGRLTSNYRMDDPSISHFERVDYQTNRAGNPAQAPRRFQGEKGVLSKISGKLFGRLSSEDPRVQSVPVHRQEYDSRMQTWQRRMQQPQSELEEMPHLEQGGRRPSSRNRRISPETGSHSMGQGDFHSQKRHQWYYDLQNKTFNRWKGTEHKETLYQHLPDQRMKLLAVFTALAFVFILCFKDLLPTNRVNDVQVSGNELVSSQEIIEASNLHRLDRVDRIYDQEKAIKKMMKKALPMLDTITFERKHWQSLNIKVTEFDIIALMRSEGVLTPVLSNGELLSFDGQNVNGESLDSYLPLLLNFEQKSKVIDLANNALRNIDPEILNNIDTISYVTDQNKQNAIVVNMKDGNEVHAIINTFAQKMTYYPQMVDQLNGKTGIINLEVGAYFKPR